MNFRAALGLWLALLFPTLAWADGGTVCLSVKMVRVPLALALPLVPELRRAETFRAAEAKLDALLLAGEAELLSWPVSQQTLGGLSKSETVVGVRFDSEFMPPQIPGDFAGGGGGSHSPRPYFYTPTCFETRDTGGTLSVQCSLDSATGLFDVSLDARYVRLEKLEPSIGIPAAIYSGPGPTAPFFSNFGVSTAFSIPPDSGRLLGSFCDRRTSSIMLFLLHVSAISATH